MTREEFALKHAARLLEAMPPGVGVNPADLTTDPPTVVPVPWSAGAEASIRAFDWSEKARQEWEDAKKPEKAALRKAVGQAIASNNAFLAVRQPTMLDLIAHSRSVVEQLNLLLKRVNQVD